MIYTGMYEAKAINKRVDQFRHRLSGHQTPVEIAEIMQQMLRPWNVKINVRRSKEVPVTELSIGGSYDDSKKRRSIELDLYFAPKQRKFTWYDYNREATMFLLRQVLQHELIHRYQMNSRPEDSKGHALYYAVDGQDKTQQEEIDYLSELDEIDAYAHDIAMEIVYHYPDEDPYAVLKNITRKRYLISWKIYAKAFKGCKDWDVVKHRLLAKIYGWLPYVVV